MSKELKFPTREEALAMLIGKKVEVRKSEDEYQVYIEENLLFTGTIRECEVYVYAYREGAFAERYKRH